MADPVGVTASLIAIASLATKIAHQLDRMIQSYYDAPAIFEAFCCNFNSTRNILIVVSKTLQDLKVNESIHGVDLKGSFKTPLVASTVPSQVSVVACRACAVWKGGISGFFGTR